MKIVSFHIITVLFFFIISPHYLFAQNQKPKEKIKLSVLGEIHASEKTEKREEHLEFLVSNKRYKNSVIMTEEGYFEWNREGEIYLSIEDQPEGTLYSLLSIMDELNQYIMEGANYSFKGSDFPFALIEMSSNIFTLEKKLFTPVFYGKLGLQVSLKYQARINILLAKDLPTRKLQPKFKKLIKTYPKETEKFIKFVYENGLQNKKIKKILEENKNLKIEIEQSNYQAAMDILECIREWEMFENIVYFYNNRLKPENKDGLIIVGEDHATPIFKLLKEFFKDNESVLVNLAIEQN